METVTHPIPPLFDASSRILILGSFPSVKSREGLFFYHHPQNRFWKVLAGVLEEPVPGSIEEKKIFLLKHRSLGRDRLLYHRRLQRQHHKKCGPQRPFRDPFSRRYLPDLLQRRRFLPIL